MRNDRNARIYLRFFWNRLEDEVLDDAVPDEAAQKLAILVEVGVDGLTGMSVIVLTARQGPSVHLCIEVPYLLSITVPDQQAIVDIAEAVWMRTRAFGQWANANEGVVGVAGLVLTALTNPLFWALYERSRLPGQRTDLKGHPRETSLAEISEALLRRPEVVSAADDLVVQLVKSRAERIELELNGEPPGSIDSSRAINSVAKNRQHDVGDPKSETSSRYLKLGAGGRLQEKAWERKSKKRKKNSRKRRR